MHSPPLSPQKGPYFQDNDESFGSVFTNQAKEVDPASFSGGESKQLNSVPIGTETPTEKSSVDRISSPQPSSGIDEDPREAFHHARMTSDDYSREPRSSSLQSPPNRYHPTQSSEMGTPKARVSELNHPGPIQNHPYGGGLYDDIDDNGTFDTPFSTSALAPTNDDYFNSTPQSMSDPYAYLNKPQTSNRKHQAVRTKLTHAPKNHVSNFHTTHKHVEKKHKRNVTYDDDDEVFPPLNHHQLDQFNNNHYPHDPHDPFTNKINDAASVFTTDSIFTSRKSDRNLPTHKFEDHNPMPTHPFEDHPAHNPMPAHPFEDHTAHNPKHTHPYEDHPVHNDHTLEQQVFSQRDTSVFPPNASFISHPDNASSVFPPINDNSSVFPPQKEAAVYQEAPNYPSNGHAYPEPPAPAQFYDPHHPYSPNSFPGPGGHQRRNSATSISTTAFAFGHNDRPGTGRYPQMQQEVAPPQPRVAAPIWFQHMPLDLRSLILKELIFSLKRNGQLNANVYNGLELSFGLQQFQVKELYGYATKRKKKDKMDPSFGEMENGGGYYNPPSTSQNSEDNQMLVRLTELLRENGNNLTLRIFDAMKLDFGLNVAQVRQMYDRNFTQEVASSSETATQPVWMFDFDYDTKRRMLLYYIQRYFEFGKLCPALFKEMADEYGLSQNQVRELHDYSKIKKSASELRPAGATSPSWARYRTKRDHSFSSASSTEPPRRKKPKTNEAQEVYVVGTDERFVSRDFDWEPLSWNNLWEQGFIISKDISVDDVGNVANVSLVLKDAGKRQSFNLMLSFNKLPSTFREVRITTTDLSGRSLLRHGDFTRRISDFGDVAPNEDCSFILLQIPSNYPAYQTLKDSLEQGNVIFSIDLAFENTNPPSEVTYGAEQRSSESQAMSAPVLRRLWSDRVFSDFTIICDNDDRISCHRCVLASSSAKFLQYFEKNMEGSFRGEFEMNEASSPIVQDFIKFMYSGEIENEEHVKPLLHLGYSYSAIALMERCLKRLCANVPPHERLTKLKSHVASLLLKDGNLNDSKSHPIGESITAKLYSMLELEEIGLDLFETMAQ